MTDTTRPGERTLYTSKDGQVIVTDRRLVLGAERWEIETIAGASLVTRKQIKLGNWLKLNQRTIPLIVLAAVCFLLGFLLMWLASGATGVLYGVVLAGVLLLYLIAFIFIWQVWLASLPNLYNLKLALQDPTGTRSEHKASYTWHDQMEAREVEQAILQAIAGK